MVQTTVAVERPNTNLSTAPSSFEELEKKFYSPEEEKQIESLMPLAKKLRIRSWLNSLVCSNG